MIKVEVKSNRFPEIADKFGAVAEKYRSVAKLAGVNEAKSRARVRTGRMRGSIRVTNAGFEVGVLYAKFNEYGTRRMSAKPFMRPGAEAAYRAWLDHLKRMEKDL